MKSIGTNINDKLENELVPVDLDFLKKVTEEQKILRERIRFISNELNVLKRNQEVNPEEMLKAIYGDSNRFMFDMVVHPNENHDHKKAGFRNEFVTLLKKYNVTKVSFIS